MHTSEITRLGRMTAQSNSLGETHHPARYVVPWRPLFFPQQHESHLTRFPTFCSFSSEPASFLSRLCPPLMPPTTNPLLPLFHPFFRLHSLSSQVLTPSRSCFISFFLPVSVLFCLHGIRPPTDIKLHKERETPSGDCSRFNKYFQIVTRVSRHGRTAGHIIKIYTGAIWGLSSATGKNTTSPNTRRLIFPPLFPLLFLSFLIAEDCSPLRRIAMRIVVFFTFVVDGRIGLSRIDIRSLATANSSVPLPLFLAGSVEIVSSFERSEILVSGGVGKEDERKGVCESSGKGVCGELLGVNCLVFVS